MSNFIPFFEFLSGPIKQCLMSKHGKFNYEGLIVPCYNWLINFIPEPIKKWWMVFKTKL